MRLIDADVLMEADLDFDTFDDCEIFYDAIDNAPTIEAEPVRHGRWDFTSCSLCGKSFLEYAEADCDHSFYRYLPYFCPNCGAKMDK